MQIKYFNFKVEVKQNYPAILIESGYYLQFHTDYRMFEYSSILFNSF